MKQAFAHHRGQSGAKVFADIEIVCLVAQRFSVAMNRRAILLRATSAQRITQADSGTNRDLFGLTKEKPRWRQEFECAFCGKGSHMNKWTTKDIPSERNSLVSVQQFAERFQRKHGRLEG